MYTNYVEVNVLSPIKATSTVNGDVYEYTSENNSFSIFKTGTAITAGAVAEGVLSGAATVGAAAAELSGKEEIALLGPKSAVLAVCGVVAACALIGATAG